MLPDARSQQTRRVLTRQGWPLCRFLYVHELVPKGSSPTLHPNGASLLFPFTRLAPESKLTRVLCTQAPPWSNSAAPFARSPASRSGAHRVPRASPSSASLRRRSLSPAPKSREGHGTTTGGRGCASWSWRGGRRSRRGRGARESRAETAAGRTSSALSSRGQVCPSAARALPGRDGPFGRRSSGGDGGAKV